MANRCYVNSIAQVSCQKPLSDEWFDSPCIYGDKYVRAQEPDTKGLIVPAEARRMSKILKRTVCTAITALNESDIKQPDARYRDGLYGELREVPYRFKPVWRAMS